MIAKKYWEILKEKYDILSEDYNELRDKHKDLSDTYAKLLDDYHKLETTMKYSIRNKDITELLTPDTRHLIIKEKVIKSINSELDVLFSDVVTDYYDDNVNKE